MKSRKRIAFEYLAIGATCMLLACALSLGFEQARHVTEPNLHWRPIDDFWSILGSVWFAMAIHSLLPTGWIFWAGFGFALKKKVPWFFLASVVPSLVAGWLWPRGYWALMSV